jgi:ribonuclease P protein component
MRRSTDFSVVVRSGTRARRGALVVHHAPALTLAAPVAPALVGIVVNKAVGGSVVRHRVSRRLRAQLAARLDRLPEGSGTVVRALPAAATATSAELGRDLDAAVARAVGPVVGGAGRMGSS